MKQGLLIFGWVIGAIIYCFASYFVWKTDNHSWFFLALILWMAISGFIWMYLLFYIKKEKFFSDLNEIEGKTKEVKGE